MSPFFPNAWMLVQALGWALVFLRLEGRVDRRRDGAGAAFRAPFSFTRTDWI